MLKWCVLPNKILIIKILTQNLDIVITQKRKKGKKKKNSADIYIYIYMSCVSGEQKKEI